MLEILAVVPQMAENIRESVLLRNLADRLQISELRVRARYQEIRAQAAKSVRAAPRTEPASETRPDVVRILTGQTTRDDRLECELLEVVFADPDLARHLLDAVPPSGRSSLR